MRLFGNTTKKANDKDNAKIKIVINLNKIYTCRNFFTA